MLLHVSYRHIILDRYPWKKILSGRAARVGCKLTKNDRGRANDYTTDGDKSSSYYNHIIIHETI